jgi:putative membrane protein insertion efficiency factor
MKKLLINLINFYRKHISPGRPACCRFMPTCSQYALDAINKYGALKGTIMAVYRILRCNPFCKGGYDPVRWILGGIYFNVSINSWFYERYIWFPA